MNLDYPIAERDHSWDAGEAKKRIKDWATEGESIDYSKYGKAFMLQEGDKDLLTSYSLPFCDVIDGKLTIIPKAVFSIAGVLQGARSGIKTSDENKGKVKSYCEKLYKKFAEKFDDEEIKVPWDKGDGMAKHSVGFSTQVEGKKAGGWVVYPDSKIFQAGDYPDKKFKLTEEEMATAAGSFKPVPLDIEHAPSPLDGKLGSLVDVRAEGKELFGTVVIPEALDSLLPKDKKISATWDTKSKRIVGLALVNHPRIEDAALMSAFSEFKKKESSYDKNPHQILHDIACSLGAECGGKRYFSSEFSTPELLEAMQKHHDDAHANGADCDAYVTRMNAKLPVHKSSFCDWAKEFSMPENDKTPKVDEAKFSELQGTIATLSSENATFKAENDKLKGEFEDLKTFHNTLLSDVKQMKDKLIETEAEKYFSDQVHEGRLTVALSEQYFAKVKENLSSFSVIKELVDMMPINPALVGFSNGTPDRPVVKDAGTNSGTNVANFTKRAEELSKSKGISLSEAMIEIDPHFSAFSY